MYSLSKQKKIYTNADNPKTKMQSMNICAVFYISLLSFFPLSFSSPFFFVFFCFFFVLCSFSSLIFKLPSSQTSHSAQRIHNPLNLNPNIRHHPINITLIHNAAFDTDTKTNGVSLRVRADINEHVLIRQKGGV